MIDRRQFCAASAALGLFSLANRAAAKSKRVFRIANPVGVIDAQQAFVTCGRHPRLGYFEAEGVDLQYVNMSSLTQSLISVATGRADIASLSPGVFLPAIAKEPGMNIVAAYNWLPRNANVVVVRPDSPIKRIADLVGKRIGVRNQGDGAVTALHIMFSELGLRSEGLSFIAVGDAGMAGTALARNAVDALASYDAAAGRIEAVGFPLRYLPLPPAYAGLSSGWFGFRKQELSEDRQNVIGFCRAVAKSTLFAHTNLQQAIRIHWALYPESTSAAQSSGDGLRAMETILRQRRENWMRQAGDADQRWGASNLEEWRTIIAIAARSTNNPQLPQQLGDPSRLFTNELVDEINRFDQAAVVRQARAFKL